MMYDKAMFRYTFLSKARKNQCCHNHFKNIKKLIKTVILNERNVCILQQHFQKVVVQNLLKNE